MLFFQLKGVCNALHDNDWNVETFLVFHFHFCMVSHHIESHCTKTTKPLRTLYENIENLYRTCKSVCPFIFRLYFSIFDNFTLVFFFLISLLLLYFVSICPLRSILMNNKHSTITRFRQFLPKTPRVAKESCSQQQNNGILKFNA